MSTLLGTEILAAAKGSVGVETYQNEEWTAIQFAASVNEYEIVETLLSNGNFDVNYKSKSKATPQVTALHIAARRGNTKLLKLLSQHCDVNVQDQWGFTALHYATVARNKGAVFCLLSNGASAIMTSSAGATAYDLAKALQSQEIMDALQSKINIETDPLTPKFKAWLSHLGAGEYLSRFVSAGYDLKFIAEKGLEPADMEALAIPRERRGVYRKILDRYDMDKFYSSGGTEESEGDSGEDEDDEDDNDEEED